MPTEFGEARVRVVLDPAQAKRQIEDLRKQIREGRDAADKEAKQSPGKQVRVVSQKIAREGRDVSGGKAEEKSFGDKLFKVAANRAKSAALRAAGPVGGQAQRAAGIAEDFLPAGLGAVAKGAATAAAVYGGIRLGTEAGVLTSEALRGMGVAGGLTDAFRKLAVQFDALEAKVQGLFKAIAVTGDYAVATARITGQAPSPSAIGAQFQRDLDVESDVAKLDKAFQRFKRNEVAQSVGASLREMVDQFFGR